jgi:hypothetical protein
VDYFECDYFDQTYFDTPDCPQPALVEGGPSVGRPRRRPLTPQPPPELDEADELFALI